MSIYALCNIWNVFGVLVFQRSILNWRRGWDQSAIDICALCYIWNLFGVMVFQTSMLNWRQGWVNLSWVYVHCAIYETYLVSCFSRHLCSIRGGVGSICHGYMCIVLYIYETYLVEGFSRYLCSIGRGHWGGSYAMGIYALCYIWNLFDVKVFHRFMLAIGGWGWGQSAMGICALCYIWNLFWCNGFPDIYAGLEEADGVNLPRIYVHCAIYIWIILGVMVFQRSMLAIGGGVESIFHRYRCIVVYIYIYMIYYIYGVMVYIQRSVAVDEWHLVWCSGIPQASMLYWTGGDGSDLPVGLSHMKLSFEWNGQ